jgi:hypothetical protein
LFQHPEEREAKIWYWTRTTCCGNEREGRAVVEKVRTKESQHPPSRIKISDAEIDDIG